MFEGKIYPALKLNPEQLKRLGCALLAWKDQEDYRSDDGIVLMIERPGLQDLLAGNRVRPTLEKILDCYEETLRELGRRPELLTPTWRKKIRADLLREGHGDPKCLSERVMRFEVLTERDTREVIDGELSVRTRNGGTPKDAARTARSLRGAIPADLVQDILIDGRSWGSIE